MAYLEPKLDWLPGDFFNFHDMNRIEKNMQEVVAMIYYDHDKSITLEEVNSTRNIESFDYFEDINRIERNLEKIRKNWIEGHTYMQRGGKQWSVVTPFTFEDARRWEYNLHVLHYFAGLEFQNYFKINCGNYNCGQGVEF